MSRKSFFLVYQNLICSKSFFSN